MHAGVWDSRPLFELPFKVRGGVLKKFAAGFRLAVAKIKYHKGRSPSLPCSPSLPATQNLGRSYLTPRGVSPRPCSRVRVGSDNCTSHTPKPVVEGLKLKRQWADED